MPRVPGFRRSLSPKRIAVLLAGSVLLLAGVAGLLLPGPGLLLLLLGLLVLATEFEWAEARVDWMRTKALDTAAESVQTWPRIVFSTFSACAVVAAGVVWSVDPTIPEFWIVGPQLPLGGLATGISILVGGVVAIGLLGYSLRRFRYGPDLAPSERRQQEAQNAGQGANREANQEAGQEA